MSENEPGPVFAFVALSSARVPTAEELLTLLRDRYRVDPEATRNTDERADAPTSVYLDVGDGFAFASLMPAPIPWGDLEGPCETAWWWPDAADAMRSHTNHFIVGLMRGSGSILEQTVWLTKLIGAVTEASDAVGVYWGSGTVVHNPEAFRELAQSISSEEFFPPLWIDFRFQRTDGGTRCLTTGLEAFGLMEIETTETSLPLDELNDMMVGLASYVMTRGAPIPDGDTFGRSAREKIKVRHTRSFWDRDGKVMRLIMP